MQANHDSHADANRDHAGNHVYRKDFYGDFGMIYALVGDNGVLYHKTDVIDTYVFRTLRTTGNPSQAMAISLFQAIMGFICVWGSNYIAKKKFKEGALF